MQLITVLWLWFRWKGLGRAFKLSHSLTGGTSCFIEFKPGVVVAQQQDSEKQKEISDEPAPTNQFFGALQISLQVATKIYILLQEATQVALLSPKGF